MERVIFSIDNWHELHTLAKFLRLMDTHRAMMKLDDDFKVLQGYYKGELEISFMCSIKDFEDYVVPSGYVSKQESFLHVSPSDYCCLVYNNGTLEPLGGLLISTGVPDTEAWTYDPRSRTYWYTS